VLPARIVVVAQDHDVLDARRNHLPTVFVTPFTSAGGIAGCWQADRPQPIRVLLALDDVDDGLTLQLVQPVADALDAIHLPNAIGATLAEILRLESHDVVEVPAAFVVVVILGDDLRLGGGLLGEQVRHRQSGGGDDAFGRAIRLTLQEHAPVGAQADTQRGPVILVRWTLAVAISSLRAYRLDRGPQVTHGGTQARCAGAVARPVS
jgi:hypothetical protein